MFFRRKPHPRFERGQIITLAGTVASSDIKRYWLISKREWLQLRNKTQKGWVYGGTVIIVNGGNLVAKSFTHRHEDDFSPWSYAQ